MSVPTPSHVQRRKLKASATSLEVLEPEPPSAPTPQSTDASRKTVSAPARTGLCSSASLSGVDLEKTPVQRSRLRQGLEEAKEFCAEVPEFGGSDSDQGSDYHHEDSDHAEVVALKKEEQFAQSTPRLTRRDIERIQDPQTLNFLAQNCASLMKYIHMDRSSQGSSNASDSIAPSPSASIITADRAFITQNNQRHGMVSASLTASWASLPDALSPLAVLSVGTLSPTASIGPSLATPSVRATPVPSECGAMDANKRTEPEKPNQQPAVLPSPPQAQPKPGRRPKKPMTRLERAKRSGEAAANVARDLESSAASTVSVSPTSSRASTRSSLSSSSNVLPSKNRSAFGTRSKKPLGEREPSEAGEARATSPTLSTASDQGTFLQRNKQLGANSRFYTLTEAEQERVEQLMADARFDGEEDVQLEDGEGFSVPTAVKDHLSEIDRKLAALRPDVRDWKTKMHPSEAAPRIHQKSKNKVYHDYLTDLRMEREQRERLTNIHTHLNKLYEDERMDFMEQAAKPSQDTLQALLAQARSEQNIPEASADSAEEETDVAEPLRDYVPRPRTPDWKLSFSEQDPYGEYSDFPTEDMCEVSGPGGIEAAT
eukprot:TRINITY_DN1873_c0_g1_i2.p1 TRINITY_DN1873_c0_g1~~TRINITY_DN1873_c0_g1_i2.p1  ORF type:complete len:600 (-),score=82.01 TRINITY_DN1873_c0_g1_i2:105-1904(-)